MPTFATPGPIAATVVVGGAEVRVTASDRTDTMVLVEPIDRSATPRLTSISAVPTAVSTSTAPTAASPPRRPTAPSGSAG
jgi:hypothetical protein